MGTVKTLKHKTIDIQAAIVGATKGALQMKPRAAPEMLVWIPRSCVQGGADLRSGHEGTVTVFEWWFKKNSHLLRAGAQQGA